MVRAVTLGKQLHAFERDGTSSHPVRAAQLQSKPVM